MRNCPSKTSHRQISINSETMPSRNWMTRSVKLLHKNPVQLVAERGKNTETAGSVVDRLTLWHCGCITTLRRTSRTQRRRQRDTSKRLVPVFSYAAEQQRDLAQGLRELLARHLQRSQTHKTYRQMKIYNDDTLNPYLYQQKKAVGS